MPKPDFFRQFFIPFGALHQMVETVIGEPGAGIAGEAMKHLRATVLQKDVGNLGANLGTPGNRQPMRVRLSAGDFYEILIAYPRGLRQDWFHHGDVVVPRQNSAPPRLGHW